nr:immunoglobulin light chain junction region [Macaca mulatta]MOV66011.1 immunoglobulin light chain junction region [Macaca mulatta]MOV66177.1 immunoglobulin light chain junction region [Macaca mulatta]MOV66249.1 immunoglobulin light chain junction region [Macaca mulatta]MOV66408.1 immunoglobulin light chain junction region [Macaca mulatta]
DYYCSSYAGRNNFLF